MLARQTRRAVVAAIATFGWATTASAQRDAARDAPGRKRVLVLYQQQADTRPMVEFSDALRRTLQTELGSDLDFYQESLDFDRFAGREESSPLASYMDDKYRGAGIDVVVPVGSRALRFALDPLRGVLPGVPIVFALCAQPQTDPSLLPAGVTGRLASASRFEPTIQLARRLQPDAQRIVLISGAGWSDSIAASVAALAAATEGGGLPIVALQGLPLDTLLRRVREIRRRSIVLFVNYRQDARGEAYEPFDIVGSIARAASAPMYTQLRSYVGEGLVGGAVTKFDDEGARTGRLVMRVLRRRTGAPLPAIEPIDNTFVVDWRELGRWNLAESRLPPRTEVLFREPTLWQQYRTTALLALALIAGESLLIGSLLVERRRRKRAQRLAVERQREADESRRQIAHMGRLAIIGELAATISHEIRQPLGAIRANAESGAKVLSRRGGAMTPDEHALCREIFTDIISDNQSASEIITRVRTLARNEDVPLRPVDLNDVCRTAARLLQHEAHARHVELTLSSDARSPVIIGDAIQLQQLVVNLALNALDVATASPKPRVTITTEDHRGKVEISVSDNGPGIPVEAGRHLFEPFFTTKPEGLGLGLAIVQSIVERHQGRVDAHNAVGGGAVFRVLLPRNIHDRAPATARPHGLSGRQVKDTVASPV